MKSDPHEGSGIQLWQFNKLLHRVKRYGHISVLFRKEASFEGLTSESLRLTTTITQEMPKAFVEQAPRVYRKEDSQVVSANHIEDVAQSSLGKTAKDAPTTMPPTTASQQFPISDDEALQAISAWHQKENSSIEEFDTNEHHDTEESRLPLPALRDSVSVDPDLRDARAVEHKELAVDEKLQAIYDWHERGDQETVARSPDEISSSFSDVAITKKKRKNQYEQEESRHAPLSKKETPSGDEPLDHKSAQKVDPLSNPANKTEQPSRVDDYTGHQDASVSDSVQFDMRSVESEHTNKHITKPELTVDTEAPLRDDKIPIHSTPLHEAWPVETGDRSRDNRALTPSKTRKLFVGNVSEEAVDIVKSIPPAKHTASPVEVQAPRRPRPQSSLINRKPAEQTVVDKEQPPQAQTLPSASVISSESLFIDTEAGPLPADLWHLIGEEPPRSEFSQTIMQKGTAPKHQVDAEASVTQDSQPFSTANEDTVQLRRRMNDTGPYNLIDSETNETTDFDGPMALGNDHEQQTAESEVPQESKAEISIHNREEAVERPKHTIDTNVIAGLVLDDILDRYAVELERLVK